MGYELLHADGRTDMTNLTVAYPNFANAHKNTVTPGMELPVAHWLEWLTYLASLFKRTHFIQPDMPNIEMASLAALICLRSFPPQPVGEYSLNLRRDLDPVAPVHKPGPAPLRHSGASRHNCKLLPVFFNLLSYRNKADATPCVSTLSASQPVHPVSQTYAIRSHMRRVISIPQRQ